MWDLHGPSSDIQQVHIQKCWNTDSSQSRWFGSFVTCNIWFKHCAAEFIHSDTITDLFCIFFNNSKLTLRFTWSFDGNMMNVWQFNNWIIARYWSYLMFYTERNIKTDWVGKVLHTHVLCWVWMSDPDGCSVTFKDLNWDATWRIFVLDIDLLPESCLKNPKSGLVLAFHLSYWKTYLHYLFN